MVEIKNFETQYTKAIKKLMIDKDLNQSDMAKKMGMAYNTFNRKLLKAENKRFNIDEAARLAMLFNVSLDEIFLNKEGI